MRNKHKQFSEKIKEKIREIFSQEQLDALAQQTGFLQRSPSRIEAKDRLELITTEILPCTTLSLEGLCDNLRQINAQAEMTPQALHSRINTENTVQYVKEVFEVTPGKNLHSQRQKISPELLAPFHRVFLQDSTQCSLHEKFSEKFI